MSALLDELAARVGVTLFDYQQRALEAAQAMSGPAQRTCLYYKTGAGKSLTGLLSMAVWGHDDIVVIAPPSTHRDWVKDGARLGIEVEAMSHAKFRMKETKLSRHKPVIGDEVHLFGGHGGKGWLKLDTMARHLQAPMILASATPNYNDADRVYCIQHILDPASCKGGFLEFLYRECHTEQNQFSMTPKVLGFKGYRNAADYLADLPGVAYLPDDLVYTIDDIGVPYRVPAELETYGVNRRRQRIIASQIEEKHTRINLSLIEDDGSLQFSAYARLKALIAISRTPVLVYTSHATVGVAAGKTLQAHGINCQVVTGDDTARRKDQKISAFKAGQTDVLVGTATLATGTDGLDKVCDTLVILDDTEDDSLRRQLIGRIMPRGVGGLVSDKRISRLVLQ